MIVDEETPHETSDAASVTISGSTSQPEEEVSVILAAIDVLMNVGSRTNCRGRG